MNTETHCPICMHPRPHRLDMRDGLNRVIHQCDACWHMWVAQSAPDYSDPSFSGVLGAPNAKERYRILTESILSYAPKSILEIGPSARNPLLPKLDIPIKHAVDPAPMPNRDGITIFQKNFADFYTDRTYDSILMSEVLEHLDDPMQALCKASALLTSKGHLHVTVPWGTHPMHHFPDWFSLEHIQYFSVNSLNRAFSLAQLEPVQVQTHDEDGHRFIVAVCEHGAPHVDRERVNRYRTEHNRRIALSLAELDKLSGQSIVVWGAGEFSRMVISKSKAFENVTAFLDSSPHKQGSEFLGKPVYHPDRLPELNADVVVIGTFAFAEEIKEACDGLNVFEIPWTSP